MIDSVLFSIPQISEMLGSVLRNRSVVDFDKYVASLERPPKLQASYTVT